MLNRLFQEQGVLKQRARITAEAVRRGEKSRDEGREINRVHPRDRG